MAAKQKYKEYRVGDLFSMPLSEGEYVFGKVLLDIFPLFKKRILAKDSPLYFGNKHSILVEIYGNTSSQGEEIPTDLQPLIPGIITNNIDLLLGKWKVLKNEAIDPKSIDFPEFVIHDGALSSHFVKGEIKTRIPLPYEATETLGIFLKELGCRNLPDVILYQLGRQGEMSLPAESRESAKLANIDLRFSPQRERILHLLPPEFQQDYYSLSQIHNLPLDRLF